MDTEFWHERWQRQDIGFHQAHFHAQLQKFWPALGVATSATVFVPLAGKSRDMVWLAAQGHQVCGVELSPIAVGQFFDDVALKPMSVRDGPFTRASAGPYTLLQGDVFDLTPDHLTHAAAVYDRAALIALPADTRQRYAAHLGAILKPATPVLLIAIDYPAGEIEGPPFAVPEPEVRDVFSAAFDIDILDVRDGLATSENLRKRNVSRMDETAYLLRRRP